MNHFLKCESKNGISVDLQIIINKREIDNGDDEVDDYIGNDDEHVHHKNLIYIVYL